MDGLKEKLSAEILEDFHSDQHSLDISNQHIGRNFIMKHPLLIEEIVPIVFRSLSCHDLKRTRLVCHEWNRMSAKFFASKSSVVIKFCSKYPNKFEVDDEYEKKLYCSLNNSNGNNNNNSCSFQIRNVQLPTFELPTDYLSERSRLIWGRLQTLKIQNIGFHECENLYLFCYHMMPQLEQLHITCYGNPFLSNNRDPKFRRNVGRLPGNVVKPGRNLRSFTGLGCFAGYIAYKDFDSDPWMKYLQQCPLLSEVALEFSDPSFLNRVVRNLLELSQRCTTTHKINTFMIKLRNTFVSSLPIEFNLHQLKSLYTSFPIRHIYFDIYRLSEHIDWHRMIEHFPPGLETLGIKIHVINDNVSTDWSSNVFTNLRKLEFKLGSSSTRRIQAGSENSNNNNSMNAVDIEPQVSFPKLTHLTWEAPSSLLPRSCPQTLASSCPALKVLWVGLPNVSELEMMISSFKSHSSLEELQVFLSCNDHGYVVGRGLNSFVGVDSIVSAGIAQMKNIKRLRLKSSSCISDVSIFNEFVRMPKLQSVQMDSWSHFKLNTKFDSQSRQEWQCNFYRDARILIWDSSIISEGKSILAANHIFFSDAPILL